MSTEDDEENARRAALLAGDRPSVLNPPSAIAAAVELGAKWAEDVAMRQCLYLPVAEWPAWPRYDQAKASARRHAAKLVADLHLHLRHRRPEAEFRSSAARGRHRAAAEALERLCYDAARTRYAELAACRLK